MAAINQNFVSLLDHAKRLDPDGGIAQIVEMLTQRNALLKDAIFKEGNLETGERVTARTGLPGVAWRRANEGTTPGKSRTDQYDEGCGQLSGLSQVDRKVAKFNGNEAAFRASEDNAFLQAMNNEVETSLLYASTKTAPEKLNGLAPRFDATANPGGSQIIKADAAAAGGDQTSIWLVKWAPEAVYGIFPKGSKVGIEPNDLGQQLVDDGTGKKFVAYVTNFLWDIGLVVKDWRSVVRIANVDTGNLAATGGSLITAMVKAYHQIFDPAGGKMAFYCNRLVGTFLHLQALNNVQNSTLRIENIGGQPVTMFLGIPVRETDALLNTEAVVT